MEQWTTETVEKIKSDLYILIIAQKRPTQEKKG